MITTLIIVFAASFVGVWLVLGFLRRKAILDHPTDRSSHEIPTPRGGGIAVTVIVVTAWAVALPTPVIWTVCLAALGLAAISWMDDLNGLAPHWRLLTHVGAVSVILGFDPSHTPYFGGVLAQPLDTIAAGLLWVWFINLFNFMDGVDGISGVETITIGLGVALVSATRDTEATRIVLGSVLTVSLAAFLFWNWHPAKIFLGDVGSVPLGFVLGWLLLDLARDGLWAPALILPLYYLVDATFTLARRALRGEKIWRPHKEHCYQKAVQRGVSHGRVVVYIAVANAMLIALAFLASRGDGPVALTVASVVVIGLCVLLSGIKGEKS